MPLFDTISTMFSVNASLRERAIASSAASSHEVRINSQTVQVTLPANVKAGDKFVLQVAADQVKPRQPVSVSPKRRTECSPIRNECSPRRQQCSACPPKPQCSATRCSPKAYKPRHCGPAKSPCLLRAQGATHKKGTSPCKTPCLVRAADVGASGLAVLKHSPVRGASRCQEAKFWKQHLSRAAVIEHQPAPTRKIYVLTQ